MAEAQGAIAQTEKMRRLSARGKDECGVLGYHRKSEVIGEVVEKEIDDKSRNSSGPRWEKVIEAKGLRLGGDRRHKKGLWRG